MVKQIRLNAFHGEDLKWAFGGVLFVYWPAGVLAHRSDSVSERMEKRNKSTRWNSFP